MAYGAPCVPQPAYVTTHHTGYRMTSLGCFAKGCEDGYEKDGAHRCVPAASATCDRPRNIVQCGNATLDSCDTSDLCCHEFTPREICCERIEEHPNPAWRPFLGGVGTQLRYCNNVGDEDALQTWLQDDANVLSPDATDPARRACPAGMTRIDCPPQGALKTVL